MRRRSQLVTAALCAAWVVAAAADAEAEGIRIAAELTQELLAVEGVRGIHIM